LKASEVENRARGVTEKEAHHAGGQTGVVAGSYQKPSLMIE